MSRLTNNDLKIIHHRYHYLKESMRTIAAQMNLPFKKVSIALQTRLHKPKAP